MTSSFRNALQIGCRIDRYEIEEIVGHGGFGISYRAINVQTGDRVALKEYLPTELATREADDSVYPLSESHLDDFRWGLERFLDEVRLLAQFNHPNIVRVHNAFEQNGTAYMVMGYEEGESLATRLKREGPLANDALMVMILPLLDGLELVHAAGFIHRDIKPGNIYLRRDGSPVLLDFGSARQALKGKTRTLTALVSAGYAPLEQYFSRSDLQGPWTDIYGLGATLYQAISGEPPIDAVERSRGVLGSARDILPPAAEAAKGDYPPCLLAAIDHALRMEEQDRPRTVAEWRNELTGEAPIPAMRTTRVAAPESATSTIAAQNHSATAKAAPPRRSRIFGLTAVLLVAAATLGWWQWSSGLAKRDTGDSIAAPTTIDRDTDKRIAELQHSLGQANTDAQRSQQRIEELTARLEALQTLPAENSDDLSTPSNSAPSRDDTSAEQLTLVAELQAALEAANRESAEARRQADELATRLKLLETVQESEDIVSPDRRAEIDALLAAADEDLRRRRLTTPPGENAYERYRKVLALESGNADALTGLERIVDAYIELATEARNRGNVSAARRFLNRAATVLPEHTDLTAAQKMLAASEWDPAREASERSRSEPVAGRLLEAEPVDDVADEVPATRENSNDAATRIALAEDSLADPSSDSAAPSLRVGIFPIQSPDGTLNLRDELVAEIAMRLTAFVMQNDRLELEYSYYLDSSQWSAALRAIWAGRNGARGPDIALTRELAQTYELDVVLTAWTDNSTRSRNFRTWQDTKVAVFVIDMRDGRSFVERGLAGEVSQLASAANRLFSERTRDVKPSQTSFATVSGLESDEKRTSAPEEMIASLSPTPVPSRALPPEPADVPLRTAILPHEWTVLSFSPVMYLSATDVGDEVVAAFRQRQGFSTAFDFRDAADDRVPDKNGLWTRNAVTSVPDVNRVYRTGAALEVDVVLMWWTKPISGFESWPVVVYLFDIKNRREYHYEGTNRNVAETVASATEQLLSTLAVPRISTAAAVRNETPGSDESSSARDVAENKAFEKGAVRGSGSAAPAASPSVVSVDARAAGAFGRRKGLIDEGSLDLVQAYVFREPGTITLSADGRIDMHPSRPRTLGIGPGGTSDRRGPCHMPLEEHQVHASGFDSLGPSIPNVGALFGSFVPERIVATPGFRATNQSLTDLGIDPSTLFLVGDELEFTAPEPGTLFLGVNDCRPGNNSGSFTVNITRLE